MQDYKELKAIGEKLNDTGFCGVITLATVLDISFKRAKRKLEKLGRIHRQGTYDYTLNRAVRNHGYEVTPLRDRGMTANQAQKTYTKGTYIVWFHGSIDHIACLKDGQYNDWIDKKYRGKAPKFQVYRIYEVTKKEK
jgi:hypothetical protein